MQDFQSINQSINQSTNQALRCLNALGSMFILLNSFVEHLLLIVDFVDLFEIKFIHHACGYKFVSFGSQPKRVVYLC